MNKLFEIRRTQDTRRVSFGKRRKTSKERESGEESANGAIYTSLGHRPGKQIGLFPEGLKARSIQTFCPFSIVRAFSPYEKGTLILGRRFACPRLI
jgi:hypothetical protein